MRYRKPTNVKKTSHDDIRTLAKRANQRMRELEKSGTSSPAYEAAQATLEMMGKKSTDKGGRRFSEGRMYTHNEAAQIRKALNRFLEAKTSTKRGYQDVIDRTWETANANNSLAESGISKEDYFELFKNLPSKHKDRMLSSTTYMAIVERVQKKQEDLQSEDKMTVAEIVDAIRDQTDVKSAYKSVGLTFEEFSESPFFED